jgi:hypothetical protein
VNAHLDDNKTNAFEQLLRKYMDIFAWTYKDFRRIQIDPNEIKLDTSISLACHVEYKVNFN